MDDLQSILAAIEEAETPPEFTATLRRNTDGSWHLLDATTQGRPETITGLLNSIREA